MEKRRSLAIISLGLACLLATACQTAGTPGQSPATAKTQATANVSTQAIVNTPNQAKGTPAQSQVTVERQGLPPRQPASRSGTAVSSAGARPATSAQQKGVANGTVESLKHLYSVFTGREIDAQKVITSAIAAAIVVLGIGAFAALSAIRHRRLTTSSSHARR
jgi:hypothetical protein